MRFNGPERVTISRGPMGVANLVKFRLVHLFVTNRKGVNQWVNYKNVCGYTLIIETTNQKRRNEKQIINDFMNSKFVHLDLLKTANQKRRTYPHLLKHLLGLVDLRSREIALFSLLLCEDEILLRFPCCTVDN